MMKRIIAVLISLFIVFSLAACGNTEDRSENNFVESTAGEDTPAENKDDFEAQPKDREEPDESAGAQPEDEGELDETQGVKVLVAYFSATNTTKGVAEHIADGLNADIYEIVPQEPYTDADLDYNDDNSRTTIEMNDPDARPAISGSVEDMDPYNIVFIGYPIWWADAPRIVSTFVESYDFSGKTVIPFCTSGSSGIGSSASNLEQLTSGAEWLSGKRFHGGDSQDTVMEWVNSLGLDLE